MPFPALTRHQYTQIRELALSHQSGPTTPRTLSQIARMVGVAHKTVKNVLQREGLLGRFEMRTSPGASPNGSVTTAERIVWARQRVHEAEERLHEQRGTVHESLWRTVLEARKAELARLEAVQS